MRRARLKAGEFHTVRGCLWEDCEAVSRSLQVSCFSQSSFHKCGDRVVTIDRIYILDCVLGLWPLAIIILQSCLATQNIIWLNFSIHEIIIECISCSLLSILLSLPDWGLAAWVGLHSSEGTFTWSGRVNATLDYDFWAPGEPNGIDLCARSATANDFNFQYADRQCSVLYAAICES